MCIRLVAKRAGSTAATASPSVKEIKFVRYLFMSIASPELDPKVRQWNETSVVSRLGLNEADAAILHTAAGTYGAAMKQA